MIKWRGSLHSPALTEAWSSWKPQAHLCSHLGRPNQNQIISFFPPSLPLSFAPERINYSYSGGNQEVPVSFEHQQQQCLKVVFYWISEPKKSPKKWVLLMIRTSCGFPNWWFIHSSSPPPPIFLPFFHGVVKRGGQEGFSVRELSQVDTEPISTGGCLFGLWRVLWPQLCLLTALLSRVHSLCHVDSLHVFNISIFLSIFFSPQCR